MPIFHVYLARTYKVRMEAPDEQIAERLAEEFVSEAKDASTAADRAEERFQILQIETVDNHAFDAIQVGE